MKVLDLGAGKEAGAGFSRGLSAPSSGKVPSSVRLLQ